MFASRVPPYYQNCDRSKGTNHAFRNFMSTFVLGMSISEHNTLGQRGNADRLKDFKPAVIIRWFPNEEANKTKAGAR